MAMQVNSSVGGISKNPCPKKLNHFADDLEKVIGAGQGQLRPSLCIANPLICFLVVQTNLFSVSDLKAGVQGQPPGPCWMLAYVPCDSALVTTGCWLLFRL